MKKVLSIILALAPLSLAAGVTYTTNEIEVRVYDVPTDEGQTVPGFTAIAAGGYVVDFATWDAAQNKWVFVLALASESESTVRHFAGCAGYPSIEVRIKEGE